MWLSSRTSCKVSCRSQKSSAQSPPREGAVRSACCASRALTDGCRVKVIAMCGPPLPRRNPMVRLIADDGDRRAPLAWTIELRDVDPLPCPERDGPVAHREGHRIADEHGLHVRRPVPFGVRVLRAAWHRALECREEVPLDVRIGILVDEDRSGRVRHGHRDDSVLDLRTRDGRLDTWRDVDGLLAAG